MKAILFSINRRCAILIVLSLFLNAACSKQPKYANAIDFCDKSSIEEQIRLKMTESFDTLEQITQSIDYKKFKSPCTGRFEIPVPILQLRRRFPEISAQRTVGYRIQSDSGICVYHYSTKSAGVKSTCYDEVK
jgi:hypothetical protein